MSNSVVPTINPSDGRPSLQIFSHEAFAQHEQVAIFYDRETDTKAIIAIHNTRLGPALGGCRMYPYQSDQAALEDVLKLAEGMSYKAALANLPQGGGKSVIIGDPRTDKHPAMMAAMGRFVESLHGKYVIAEDSGISVSDIAIMAEHTQYASGFTAQHRYDGEAHDGNPAPATAYGVFVGMQAAVKHRLGRDLNGLTVAIQGVGQVGRRLANHCLSLGCQLILADTYAEHLSEFANNQHVTIVDVAEIHRQPCDVYAPCALGGSLAPNTVHEIQASVIAGAANNQLADPRVADILVDKHMLYAPDFVINAGGIIDIYHQQQRSSAADIQRHLESIGTSLTEIFVAAEAAAVSPDAIAQALAKAKLGLA